LKRLKLKKDGIPVPYINENEVTTDTEVSFNLLVRFTFKNYAQKVEIIEKNNYTIIVLFI